MNVVTRFRAVTVALVCLLLGIFVFQDFIFGSKVLLYKDIGSDSLNFHYPYFIHLSEYLRSNGLPGWSFNVGMGQSLYLYVNSLLFDPVVWLPKRLIAQALVHQHLLKLIICGILFFKFLELRSLTFAASFLGALVLSLSAYMCMGSCWTNVGNDVVCLTFVLFAIEAAIVRGRWIYVPLAVACCGILTPFHLYLCGLLLVIYVPARLLVANGRKLSLNAKNCVQLAAAAVIGVGLAAVVWLDGLATIVSSPRGSGIASYANKLSSFPVFALETPLHYATAVLRQFSNEMAGTGNDFRGWQNYLEAPLGYCGLFCLLILPQVFVASDRRQRIAYGLFLGAITIPVLFPWFRYLFWLFQGDYYRTFSLFSVFGIVTLSMTAFSRYIERGTFNAWLLALTLLVLLAVLYWPVPTIQALITPKIRDLAVVLLLAYGAILTAGRYFKRESAAGWLIITLCAIELYYFDRIAVAYRPTVTKPELRERVAYNDYTVDAVRDIQAKDKGFYRITKLYSSGPAMHKSLNDALVFGYYNSSSYSSFNNINYIRFLMALDVIPLNATENETRWALGLLGRRHSSAFACEKYILAVDPVPFQVDPGYEYLKRYEKAYLFRNKSFVPLGRFYTRYLPETEFMRLSTSAKERLLHSVVVLSANDSAATSGIARIAPESPLGEVSPAAFQLRFFSQNRITGEIQCDSSGMLVFQTPFDRGWRALVDGEPAETFKADVGLLGVGLRQGKHLVEIRYLPPFLKIGSAITALSLLIFGVSLWRWPRISPALSSVAEISKPVPNSGH